MISELRVLDLGTVRGVGVPIAAYLLTLADGRRVLVDSGCPKEMVGDPESPFAAVHVRTRLAELGVAAGDISMVIVSHLDPDHCGAHDEFPDAEFVVQRAQLDHARSSGLHRYEWMRAHWDDPRLRYRCVDGDTELLPGLSVVECGGHVPGHQAVLVDLPRTGLVMLAGDAWMRDTDPDTRDITPFDLDEAKTRAAQRKLMTIAREREVRLVVHNHDLTQWPTLREAYQ
ncbi:N-acyl homoserine lactonase family protein [Fodinicola acaciae]|uniref:N-acyl homoserine lactonase family protein n=1 Tax=Fodinicola acaciae TaxID=2681555 RepID=UPI0013D63027|nr:N-acyl homoserine lactonase family protein [Fodinicola acaciae]